MSEQTFDPRNLVELGGGEEVFTEFSEVEFSLASIAQPRERVAHIQSLSPALVYRRVYFYAEAALQTYGDDFAVNGEVVFTRNNRPIARVPAGIGRNLKQGLAWSKSVASLSSATNNPGPDCLQLALSYKFSGNTSQVFLSPMRLYCQADAVYWSITSLDRRDCNIDNLRAYLAVLSSNRA